MKLIILLSIVIFLGLLASEAEAVCSDGNCRAIARFSTAVPNYTTCNIESSLSPI